MLLRNARNLKRKKGLSPARMQHRQMHRQQSRAPMSPLDPSARERTLNTSALWLTRGPASRLSTDARAVVPRAIAIDGDRKRQVGVFM